MADIARVVMLSLVLLLAGCAQETNGQRSGGDTGDERSAAKSPGATSVESAEEGAARRPRYTRGQVIDALAVTRGYDENGVPNSDLRTGCFASKIFLRPEDNMQAYLEIGDPVATNPSGTVGVLVGSYQGTSSAKCLRIFDRRLAKLGE